MSNILNDVRELKIDELEVVSGGSFVSQAGDAAAAAILGFGGVIFVDAVTRVAIAAAKATVSQKG